MVKPEKVEGESCCNLDAPHHHLIRGSRDYGPVCEPRVGFEHPEWCKETWRKVHGQ